MTSLFTSIKRSAHIALWLTFSIAAQAQDAATEFNQMYGDAVVATPASRSSDWRGFLGAGVLSTQQTTGDSRAFLVPVIAVSYKDIVYWQAARAGVWLLRSDDRRTRAGIAMKVRRGYDPENIDGLVGMERRDNSLEAGITGTWATRPVIVSAAYYTDVSGTSDGDSTSLTLAHPFRLGERWRVTPSVSAEWLDSDVISYYYGVKPNEATATRPAYTGRSAVNLRTGIAVHYALTRAWSLFAGLGYTHLGAGITDSPIVIHDGVTALHIGGGWRF